MSGYSIANTPAGVEFPSLWDTVTTFNSSPPTVNAGGFLRLWANGTTSPSGVNLNFKLSKDGEQIILYAADTEHRMDCWAFGDGQRDNMSEGRAWDGGPSGRQTEPELHQQIRDATQYQAVGAARLPITPGTANHSTTRNSFIAASGVATDSLYLRWYFLQNDLAVYDYTPKDHDFHAVNIEGIAYRPAGNGLVNPEMIIGLRSPLSVDRISGNALYYRVTAVDAFLPVTGGWSAAAPGLTGPLYVNLNGQGFRSIEWCPGGLTNALGQEVQRYLVLGGPAGGGPLEKEFANEKFSLYAWDGTSATPTLLVADLRNYTTRPEGLTVLRIGGHYRLMFVEDRYQATGYGARNAIHWPISVLPKLP